MTNNELEGRKRARNEDDDGNDAKRMNCVEEKENKENKEEFLKQFIVKAVFKDVSELEEGENYNSSIEEHYGVPWYISMYNENGHLGVYLLCNRRKVGMPWSIETNFTMKVKHPNGKWLTTKENYCFTEREGFGEEAFLKWEEMKKDYLVDDKLTVEVHVGIKNTTGVYPEKLRSFDNPECSDIIFSVKNQKFYVSKLYLADQSSSFKALFPSSFDQDDKSEIVLNGIDPYDFQKYLEVLYGIDSINEMTVEGVLDVADMYETPMVVEKCEDFLSVKSEKSKKKKLEMETRYNLKTGVILTVQDQKFPVLKLHLSIHSSFFKKLIWEKCRYSEKFEISLDGIEPDEFEQFHDLLLQKDYYYSVKEVHVGIKNTTGVHPENLRSFENPECSDVILSVKNQKFHVSKYFLADQSPYFNALFLRGFSEKEKSEICLNGIDPYDFQKYLEVLYGIDSINEMTVEGILDVADMYETPIVVEKCEDFLSVKSEKSKEKKLEMADRYNLKNEVILIVKDQKIPVLKLHLSIHSSFFKNLFWEKCRYSEKSEITLDGIDPNDFKKYLGVLHGNYEINDETVERMFEIAQMYDTSIVTERCENFLFEKSKKSKEV